MDGIFGTPLEPKLRSEKYAEFENEADDLFSAHPYLHDEDDVVKGVPLVCVDQMIIRAQGPSNKPQNYYGLLRGSVKYAFKDIFDPLDDSEYGYIEYKWMQSKMRWSMWAVTHPNDEIYELGASNAWWHLTHPDSNKSTPGIDLSEHIEGFLEEFHSGDLRDIGYWRAGFVTRFEVENLRASGVDFSLASDVLK